MHQETEEPYHITMEIENKHCTGLRILEKSGVKKYALMDIRGTPEGPTRHLIKIPHERFKDLPKKLFAKTQVDKSGKIKSAWFHTDGCDICNTILANSSFLVSARHIEGRLIIYSFVTPNFDAYNDIISTLEREAIKFKILEVTKFNPRTKTLTEKQERILWLALKMGFFSYPRKITMLELSKRAGVGLSTISEIIRRGTRRLVEEHFQY